MKKIFTLVAAAFVAVGVSAQVQSTRVELSPLYADAANSDGATWKFTNTDITITNVDAKTYASTGIYTDANGVATAREFMKMSRGKKWTLVVPEDRAVVRIEFWGFSNSSAMNWAYLRYVTNPAVEVLADVSPEGQVKENETIKAYAHPFSPEAVTAEAAPLAVFEDKLGWYGELSFYFDGNNQVGANIVVYTVPDAEIENYDPAKDNSIKAELDMPAAPIQSTRVELSPLYADAANSDAATWKFTNTDITITNVDAKTYASTGRYYDAATSADATPEVADTTAREFMKMSRGKVWTLAIPEDRAVVRIEFWGFSNSSAMNWAYLRYVTNPAATILADVSPEGQVKENETIKAYACPFSPEAEAAEAAPLAVFADQLGWFSEISFYFDGNNQVGANVVVYTVPEADLENYDPAKDSSIKAELDMPVVEEPSAIESVENDEVKALDPNAPMYNILGQPVGADYKGIVIQKGAKFILR